MKRGLKTKKRGDKRTHQLMGNIHDVNLVLMDRKITLSNFMQLIDIEVELYLDVNPLKFDHQLPDTSCM